MENKATCIMPKPVRSPEIQYKGKDSEIWLGEVENGMKVNLFNITRNFVTQFFFILAYI